MDHDEHDKKAPPVDSETILMTLDQIGQTIDIMNNVVERLRGYIYEHIEAEAQSNNVDEDKITHHYSHTHLH